jgi:hypothetical protein
MTSLAQEFPQLGLRDVSLSHLKQACVKASEYVTPTDLQDFCATLGHTYAQTSSPLVQMVARDARALSASAASASLPATAPVSSMPTVQVLPVHHLETVHHIQTPIPVTAAVVPPVAPPVVPPVPSKAPSAATNIPPVPPAPQSQAPEAASGLQSLLDALNATK